MQDHNSKGDGDDDEEGSFVSQENHNNNDEAEKRQQQQHRLPRPPPISPKIIVRKCQSVTPPSSSSLEDLRVVTSSSTEISQSSVEKKIVAQKSETNNREQIVIPQQPVRRKDLCKLLGLNNDSDINGVPEGRVAQKVALLHTAKAGVVVPKDDRITSDRIPASTTEVAEPVKRKNLAKFLGVDSVEGTTTTSTEVEASVERESSKERRPFGKDSLSRYECHFICNFFQNRNY